MLRLLTMALALVLAWSLAAGQQDASPDDEGTDESVPVESELTEQVVVSATATSVQRLDAPAAVDILDGDEIEELPGDNLTDHLRRVPGVNVVQFSARDVNIAPRQATGSTNKSTLVLADGRNLYQDFFGFVMWEFAPSDFSLVDRVEVVRGPGSSLWGANAVGGLVQVITKSAHDTPGGQLRLYRGSYDTTRVDLRQTFVTGPWAVRVSGSFNEQDAFDRPRTIVNWLDQETDPDLGVLVDDFRDSGTRQPRLDVRADWRGPLGGTWMLQGGSGRTRGWIATGLGPFDIDPGTSMSYLQARYTQGPYEFQAYSNVFDGEGKNLVTPLTFGFTSTLTQASFRGRTLLGTRGVLGWGFESERSTYDLSIAPAGDGRTRAGAFAELDAVLAPRWQLIGGARIDHFRETIGTVVSPRAALRFKPNDRNTLRVAWGRAFRAPTVIETDLDVTIPVALLDWVELDQLLVEEGFFEESDIPNGFFALLAGGVCSQLPDNCGEPAGAIPQYLATTATAGTRELDEERTDSLELGYAAQIGPLGLSATLYQTRSKNGIDFPTQAFYGNGVDGIAGTADDVILPTDPDGDGFDEAPAFDLCPELGAFNAFGIPEICAVGPLPYNQLLTILLDGRVPALFKYANGSRAENYGAEVGATWTDPRGFVLWTNYSWQSDPRTNGVSMSKLLRTVKAQRLDDGSTGDTADFINIPAAHRVSIGAQIDRGRWHASLTGDFVDDAFWQDMQTDQFWGWTDEYTLVGIAGGYRWRDRGLELTAQVTNLFDDAIQQHVLGDVIERRATLGLKWNWDGSTSRPRSDDGTFQAGTIREDEP